MTVNGFIPHNDSSLDINHLRITNWFNWFKWNNSNEVLTQICLDQTTHLLANIRVVPYSLP